MFCPGPAYPGLGPKALAHRSGQPAQLLTANTPVYSGYRAEGDFFAIDPKMRTPYIQNST